MCGSLQSQVLVHKLICVSGLSTISLNKPLLFVLKTPAHVLLSFDACRQMNSSSLVTPLLPELFFPKEPPKKNISLLLHPISSLALKCSFGFLDLLFLRRLWKFPLVSWNGISIPEWATFSFSPRKTAVSTQQTSIGLAPQA